MPEICRFLGIVISIYFKEHAPPHFHAEYGNYEITIDINTGVVTGTFPRRALSAVIDWYVIHKDELMADWNLAVAHKPLNKIDPLE